MGSPDSVSRRRLLGGGLAALVLAWCDRSTALTVVHAPAGGPAPSESRELTHWVSIDASGRVALAMHKAEMGQGVYTAIPQLLAEELEVDLGQVAVVLAPFSPERFGSHLTGGSASIRLDWKRLLQAGATARDMLVRAAAERWGVEASTCTAESGRVLHPPTARALAYGELVEAAARLQPLPDVPLKPAARRRLVGRPVARLDTPQKVDGSARFGIDVRVPGMLHAVVERSPHFEGRLVEFDPAAAMRVPGVVRVLPVRRDAFGHLRDGVAVVAENTWAAMQGRRALHVRWADDGLRDYDTESLRRRRLESLDGPVLESRRNGDAAQALSSADGVIEAIYDTPYQAHACLEPPNATAHATRERVDVWAPMQGPEWVRDTLVGCTGRPAAQFRLHPTLLGGAFGRKGLADYPSEAALLAIALGRPVQIVWTREDDLAMGPFRPGMTYRLRGSLRDGRLHALESITAGQNFEHHFVGSNPRSANRHVVEGVPAPFLATVPHQRWADAPLAAPIPTMWWRAVYASTNCFAFECFIDELARAANQDPIQFRRRHFERPDALRHRRVLDELVRVSGWDRREDAAQLGWGASLIEAFHSVVGQVVVVAERDGRVTIERVHVVIDCGWVVNPGIVQAQVEGSIVMAWGAAVQHETGFREGRAEYLNFADYPLPRIGDVPPVDVHIVATDGEPGGVGEPAVPGFAPALANAVFDLTGKRIRSLPFSLATAGIRSTSN